jgi:O-antigen ligase
MRQLQPIGATQLHGLSLVVLAASIPLGEGATLAATVAMAALLWARRAAWPRPAFGQGDPARCILALAIYVAAGLAAVGLGGHGAVGTREWGRLGPWLLLPLGYLSATCLPRLWLRRAAWAFVGSLTVAALFGLTCYAADVRPGESWLRPSALIEGQGRVPGSLRSAAAGFYFHRLKMAHVLLLGLAALWGRQMVMPLARRRRAIELAALVVRWACLLLTFARAAALGGALASVACLCFAARPLRWAGLCLAVVGCLGLSQLPGVQDRLLSSQTPQTASVRGLIWSQAVRAIADHPLGVGLGNYTQVIGRYYDQVDPSFATRTYPHNVLLAAWAETGPVGLFAYAAIWLHFLWACLRRLVSQVPAGSKDTAGGRAAGGRRGVAAAGLFAVCAFWTVGLTHDVLYHNVVGQAYVAFMAWTFAMLQETPDVTTAA